MLPAVFFTCFVLLALAVILTGYRLLRGPTAADRILAIDLLAVCTASATMLYALSGQRAVFIDVVVVLGAIVFFGTVALAQTLSKPPEDQ